MCRRLNKREFLEASFILLVSRTFISHYKTVKMEYDQVHTLFNILATVVMTSDYFYFFY